MKTENFAQSSEIQDEDISTNDLSKPRLRGVSHLIGAIVALPMSWVLYHSSTAEHSLGALIYSFSLVGLLATSATYHVPQWNPTSRAIMRRIDHAMIFVLIGGSYTPFLLALWDKIHPIYAILILGGCALGFVRSLISKPQSSSRSKPLRALTYGSLGVSGVLLTSPMYEHFGPYPISMILIGGAVYLTGAMAYAFKRPNPIQGTFEYHEVFHTFVLIAAAIHYLAIEDLVTRSSS